MVQSGMRIRDLIGRKNKISWDDDVAVIAVKNKFMDVEYLWDISALTMDEIEKVVEYSQFIFDLRTATGSDFDFQMDDDEIELDIEDDE